MTAFDGLVFSSVFAYSNYLREHTNSPTELSKARATIAGEARKKKKIAKKNCHARHFCPSGAPDSPQRHGEDGENLCALHVCVVKTVSDEAILVKFTDTWGEGCRGLGVRGFGCSGIWVRYAPQHGLGGVTAIY
jgi:hypothetical protein